MDPKLVLQGIFALLQRCGWYLRLDLQKNSLMISEFEEFEAYLAAMVMGRPPGVPDFWKSKLCAFTKLLPRLILDSTLGSSNHAQLAREMYRSCCEMETTH